MIKNPKVINADRTTHIEYVREVVYKVFKGKFTNRYPMKKTSGVCVGDYVKLVTKSNKVHLFQVMSIIEFAHSDFVLVCSS